MDTNFDIVKADGFCEITSGQVAVECVMNSSDTIADVLGVSAYCTSLTGEAMNGEISFSGSADFKAVCISSDGKLFSPDYVCEYKTELKGTDIRPDTVFYACQRILESNAQRLDETSVKASALIEITVFGVCKKEIKTDTGSDCITSKKCVKSSEFVTEFDSTFDTSEEIETKADVINVLIARADIAVKDVRCQSDIVTVIGEIDASVVYTTDASVVTKNIVIPFSQENVALNTTADSFSAVCASVKSARIVIEGVEGNNVIRLEVIGKVEGVVFNTVEREVLADAYSLTQNVSFKKECFEFPIFKNAYYNEEHIGNSLRIGEDAEPISRILTAFSCGNNVSAVTPFDNKLVLSGVVDTTVIYTQDDNSIKSVKIEIPYSMRIKAEGLNETDEVNVCVSVAEVTAVSKRAREIEVMSLLKVRVTSFNKEKECLITDVSFTGEKNIGDACISVYVTDDNDTVFDIAKALNTTPEIVTETNPNLSEPIEKGRKIAVFRPLI